jgi:hypothetical protein
MQSKPLWAAPRARRPLHVAQLLHAAPKPLRAPAAPLACFRPAPASALRAQRTARRRPSVATPPSVSCSSRCRSPHACRCAAMAVCAPPMDSCRAPRRAVAR